METKDARSLSPEAQEALRMRAVKAVEEGMSQTKAAHAFGVSDRVVRKWIKGYRSGGVKSLRAQQRGAKKRPGLLQGHQAALVVRLITDHCPDQIKLPHALWTRKAVQELLYDRFSIQVGLTTVSKLLKGWGMTPQKPIKRAYEQNPVKVKKWLDEEYPSIQSQAKKEKATIFWGDEMGIRSDHQAGRSFSKKGQTPVIKNAGRRFSFNMISAISNKGNLNFMLYEENFTVDVFIQFMQRMIRQRKEKVFLILDNLKVHHAKKAKAWVEKHSNEIELFFCPLTAQS